ncbi:cell cycle inhibitor Nif1 protein [Rutstroemia sp. NJR-2017a WRK4]|nr:cell cycle inhibitor Nif1 protein [Rutstroemia sp. NJR-2017a WRK4]
MPLLDLLKKKDKVAGHDLQSPRADPEAGPVFTFMRSDTHTQEVISPPTFSTSEADPPSAKRSSHENRATRLFKGSNSGESGVSGASGASSSHSHSSNTSTPKPPHGTRKIAERFGLRKHEAGSSHVPSDLPEITVEAAAEDKAHAEVQWEKRATILAQQNERSISRPGSSYGSSNNGASGGARNGVVASRNTDEDLQEGIRLHESGQFEEATKIFARLADPNGDNHALSQILYCTLKAGKSQPSGSPDIIIRRRSLFASSDLLFAISCSSC